MDQPILSDNDDDNEEQPISDENHDQGHPTQQIQTISSRGRYFLEFALTCLFFGNNLPSTLLQNQILKACCFNFADQLNYNDSLCNIISKNQNSTKEIEEKIQPYAAEFQMYVMLISTLIPAVLSLFLGPYSDKYGRKKILNSTFSGFTLTLVLLCFVCFYSDYISPISPWFYTLAYIPQAISGGWCCLLTASLCYITDTTEESRRAHRLTLVEMIIFAGVLLGNISCNFLLPITDATQIFIISASFAALATIVMIVCVDESVNVPQTVSTCDNLKSLFTYVHLVDMLKTCFKKRSFKERRILLSLMSMLILTVFTYSGSAAVSYLSERERFGWTLTNHNNYDSINIIFSISGCIIGIAFLKKQLNFSEMSLIILSVISGVVDASLKAFAIYGWQMYAISAGAMFRILASPMYRTLITTIVPHNEIGKVFSITTALEAISGFPSVPLYTIVYAKTLTFFPGAYFLITAGIYATNLLFSIFVMIMKRTRDNLVNPYVVIEN